MRQDDVGDDVILNAMIIHGMIIQRKIFKFEFMYIIVLITCAKKQEALKIINALLVKKLAACVNIVDKVESFFLVERQDRPSSGVFTYREIHRSET